MIKFTCLLVAVLFSSGCANGARFETSGGGHPIVAHVEGAHTVESRESHATIVGEFGRVAIERDRARVDAGPWERIPEGTPVQARISRREVSIRAGAVTISRPAQ